MYAYFPNARDAVRAKFLLGRDRDEFMQDGSMAVRAGLRQPSRRFRLPWSFVEGVT